MSFASVLRGVLRRGERDNPLARIRCSPCFNLRSVLATPTCIIFACSSVMEKHSYCSGFQNYIIYEVDNANNVLLYTAPAG